MKETEKIWITFLLVITAIFSVLGFAGCKKSNEENGLKYTLSDDGSFYTVHGIERRVLKDVVIPATYKDLPVRAVEENAFKDCNTLTSVTIGNNVTEIKDGAFLNCGNLKSIVVPDGVTYLGYSAFRYCSNLTNVNIPKGITEIFNPTFQYCSSLTSVTLGSGLTWIGREAFSCYNLTSVVFKDTEN